MGSLEAWGVAEGDWTKLSVSSHLRSLFFGSSAWRISSCGAASLQAGVNACGTRGHFQEVHPHQSAWLIAKLLGRSPSTVSREMSCSAGDDRYRATLADENAWARSRLLKCCKLATNPERLRQAVAGKAQIGLVTRADSRLAEENAS